MGRRIETVRHSRPLLQQQQQQQQWDDKVDDFDDSWLQHPGLSCSVTDVTPASTTTTDAHHCRSPVVVVVTAERALGHTSASYADQSTKPIECLALNLNPPTLHMAQVRSKR